MYNSNNFLKTLHINIKSLKNKKERLNLYLEEKSIGIASINETWLKKSTKLSFKSYNVVRKDRDSRAGGVCLVIKKDIKYEEIDFSQFSDEIVGVSITNPGTGSKWHFISLYIPPEKNFKLEIK